MSAILDKILRAGEGRILRRLSGLADQVNALEDDFVSLSDTELRELTAQYRARLADGETLDEGTALVTNVTVVNATTRPAASAFPPFIGGQPGRFGGPGGFGGEIGRAHV